jgi:hypothetical protein
MWYRIILASHRDFEREKADQILPEHNNLQSVLAERDKLQLSPAHRLLFIYSPSIGLIFSNRYPTHADWEASRPGLFNGITGQLYGNMLHSYRIPHNFQKDKSHSFLKGLLFNFFMALKRQGVDVRADINALKENINLEYSIGMGGMKSSLEGEEGSARRW